MRNLLVAVTALLLLATTVRAGNIPGCTNNKCEFPPDSNTQYFCDKVCTGGSCSANGDVCPGHCSETPWIACISDGPCPATSPTANVCIGGTSQGGTCKTSSPNPGALCVSDSDCCQDDGDCVGTVCFVTIGDCCDLSQLQPFLGDGKAVTCGSNNADTITGTSGDDVICAKNGGDTINAGAGDDWVDGGNGNDAIYGKDGPFSVSGDGNNILYGGADNDSIWGASGNDIIFGGAGTDGLVGQGGRDELNGGDGNDTLLTMYGNFSDNGVLGSLLCGGAGDDTLFGNGPGHQCMDGGSGQSIGAGQSDCLYYNVPDDTDAHDVATARNCLNATHNTTGGTLLSSPAGCGCD